MPKWFKCTYFPYISEDPKTGKKMEVFRPTIPVMISYDGNPSWDFQALIDSGADRNLFPAKLGESIGIDIRSGKKRSILGIGGYKIIAYTHKVKILCAGKSFDTEIDFSYEHEQPLLGRDGFFNLFKHISFSEKIKEMAFKF